MNESFPVIAEPFIGQVEYLKHLTDPAVERATPYLEIEFRTSYIETGAMGKAFALLVRRHESLRTVFPRINGEVRQMILPYDKERFSMSYIETDNGEAGFRTLYDRTYRTALKEISDLAAGPLVKLSVFRIDRDSYCVLFLIHHIISDVWSLKVIRSELEELYSSCLYGEEPKLQPLSFQLRDYCEEKNRLYYQNKDQLSTFWKERLKGYAEMFDIGNFYKGYGIRHNDPAYFEKACKPADRKELLRILDQVDGSMFVTHIGNDRISRIRELGLQHRCSVSAVLYTSFYIFLFIYCRKSRILLASLTADRFVPAYRNLIGCLLGGIYLPREITGNSIVSEIMEETFRGLEEGMYKIINNHDILDIDGQEVRSNCDIYINYIFSGKHLDEGELPGRGEHGYMPDVYYPLSIKLSEFSNDMAIEWRYNKTLFTKELIEDMVRCHRDILDTLIVNGKCTVKKFEYENTPHSPSDMERPRYPGRV